LEAGVKENDDGRNKQLRILRWRRDGRRRFLGGRFAGNRAAILLLPFTAMAATLSLPRRRTRGGKSHRAESEAQQKQNEDWDARIHCVMNDVWNIEPVNASIV